MKHTVKTSALALAAILLLGAAPSHAAGYKASTEDKPVAIVNLEMLEAQVQKRMEPGAFGYIRGADVVAVGRPILYGLNLGGAEGVYSVIEHLNKELRINMMLAGAANIEAVKKTTLYTDADFE